MLAAALNRTIISQYANSPTLRALIEDMNGYLDPRVRMADFYQAVWNVDTAVGFGLDIWGRIVGVGRVLRIPHAENVFGFFNSSVPADWQPMGQAPFFTGTGASQSYILPDDIYRTLILVKALANITATNAASMNRLLQNLFPGRGKAYVRDNGNMTMTFVFEFALTAAEYAILTESGVLPHPAGVGYDVVVIPVAAILFGFSEAGAASNPYSVGTFYLPTGP